jgi:putative peptidoglycan lipid II flippase
VKLSLPALHPVVVALMVLSPYGVVFFGVTLAFGLPEASVAFGRFLRRR